MKRLLAIAALGWCVVPAAAMPLQVSLEALDAPALAGEQAGLSPPAQFVVAGRQPPAAPAEPDEELPLVAAETLPQALPEPVTEIGGLPLAAPADVGLPAVEKALAAEDALGDFMPSSSPDGRDGGDPLDERAIAADAGTPAAAAAPRDVAASAAAAVPLSDLDALRQQRATLQWVVLPLVLVAMVLLWVGSQQRRHRHGHSSSHHAHGRSRRRRGRGSAAPPDPHRA
ncbi:MAG: hypothetical protein QM750_17560 [Rubrivivax sp.]